MPARHTPRPAPSLAAAAWRPTAPTACQGPQGPSSAPRDPRDSPGTVPRRPETGIGMDTEMKTTPRGLRDPPAPHGCLLALPALAVPGCHPALALGPRCSRPAPAPQPICGGPGMEHPHPTAAKAREGTRCATDGGFPCPPLILPPTGSPRWHCVPAGGTGGNPPV